MPPTALRRAGRRRLPFLLVALLIAGSVVSVTAPVDAQPRRVVVVGDSVILGAESQIVGAFQRAGWAATFDAAVNRSTLAGAEAVRAHAGELTDTLVINLGANDAGNADTYRQRVDVVMAAAGATPRVYWMTIREVRPYYAPANQVLREAAERYPNLDLIDWNAATAGSSGLTSGDGLHLTPAGASSMAFLIGATVTVGSPPAANAQAPAAEPAPTVAPTTIAPTPTAAAPVPPSTAVPEPVAPPASAPVPTTVTAPPTTAGADPDGSPSRVVLDDGEGGAGLLGWSIGLGLTAVVAVLALSGAWIAVWSLLRTRGTAEGRPVGDRTPGDADGDHEVDDRSTRSRLRAARIAASRAHHPTAVPPGLTEEASSPSESSASVSQS